MSLLRVEANGGSAVLPKETAELLMRHYTDRGIPFSGFVVKEKEVENASTKNWKIGFGSLTVFLGGFAWKIFSDS